jgi:hypothetical protein
VSHSPTGFLGLARLGISSSIGWASLGSSEVAADLGTEVVDQLRMGGLPAHAPSLAELFAATRERMTFSADPSALAACDLVIGSRETQTDADSGEFSMLDAPRDSCSTTFGRSSPDSA